MIDCLLDLIDLKKCGNAGLIKLSDLPFDYKQYADVSKQDSATSSAEDVIESIARNAIRRIKSDLIDKVDVRLESLASNCFGKLSDVVTDFTGVNGINVELQPSNYIVLYIDKVSIYSPFAQTVDLYVDDGFNQLWSQTVDLVFGRNEIPINISVPATNTGGNIFIGYDQNLSAYEIKPGYSSINQGCLACCTCNCACKDSTGGLLLNYRIECSFDQLICSNAHLFDDAIINAFGVEYIYWNHGSFRINSSKTKSKDHMMMLLENYEQKYIKALNAAIKRLNLCDDCCFECKEIIQSRYVCP